EQLPFVSRSAERGGWRRNRCVNDGALLGVAVDGQRAADETGPLLDAQKTEPAILARTHDVESLPVVNHRQVERPPGPGDRHGRAPRAAMREGIPQRLLGDAKQAELDVGAD